MPVRKVVVIGPESTGKSTLCEGLAAHFGTDWAAEYAREYLLRHGKHYQYEDLLTMARGQLELEERKARELERRWRKDDVAPILFIDTDMYVMKVWSEFVFGRCEAWILDQVATRKYDGYLLCKTDLPWTADELREYPDDGPREQLFHIYRDCMINQSTPWKEIGGCEEDRLTAAIAAVKNILVQ
ncbi:MAG TPA: AAA family ATPase [Puia sp.]|jgi:NadR type nicotinamide-nucleotide adenylyltransferase